MNIPKAAIDEIAAIFDRKGTETTDTQSFVYRTADEVLSRTEFMNDSQVSVDEVHMSYHDGNAIVTCALKPFLDAFYDEIADGHTAVVKMQQITSLGGKRVFDLDKMVEWINKIDFNMNPEDVKAELLKTIRLAEITI